MTDQPADAGSDDLADRTLAPEATETDQRLLARARELGALDLAERPDAFAELDQAIVAELRAIEDL